MHEPWLPFSSVVQMVKCVPRYQSFEPGAVFLRRRRKIKSLSKSCYPPYNTGWWGIHIRLWGLLWLPRSEISLTGYNATILKLLFPPFYKDYWFRQGIFWGQEKGDAADPMRSVSGRARGSTLYVPGDTDRLWPIVIRNPKYFFWLASSLLISIISTWGFVWVFLFVSNLLVLLGISVSSEWNLTLLVIRGKY